MLDPDQYISGGSNTFGIAPGICVNSNVQCDATVEDSFWSEELSVLEAIYGDDVKCLSPSSVSISTIIPAGDVRNLEIEVRSAGSLFQSGS